MAEPWINQLLDAVSKATGITGRLMKKRGEPHLWTEVYENVTFEVKFERELAEAVGKLNATGFLQTGAGPHIECFEEP
ncbi:MAG: DUF4936 family protein [Betaproteobacteria bacterium]|nr:DUF4936 family protein [Betaproteobacteria bacterium]